MNGQQAEDVAVYVPGLSRPLYGNVLARRGKTVTVRVFHDGEHATMTVDADLVRPWRHVEAR